MEHTTRACAGMAAILAGCALSWPAPLKPRDASTEDDATDGDVTADADAEQDAEPDTRPDPGSDPDAASDPDAVEEPDLEITEIEEEDAQEDIPAEAEECNEGDNVAPTATPSTSGGGSGSWGPDQLVNGQYEDTCSFNWVVAGSTPGTAYFELDWTSDRTLWGMWIDTNHYLNTLCWSPGGVSLAGGTIQFWDSTGSWADAGVVSGRYDDWGFEFVPPVTTTRVRIYGAHATDMGGQTYNPLIYEWEVFECAP